MRFIKDYFHFNKRQERGVLVLAIIIVILMVINHYTPQWSMRSPESLQENQVFIEELKLKSYEELKRKNAKKAAEFKNENVNIVLNINKVFDPNTITMEELIKIGLPKYVAHNVNKYRLKGGRFNKSSDIEKIYGLNHHLSEQLIPWIRIPKPKRERKAIIAHNLDNKEDAKIESPRKLLRLGINSSDSMTLLKVKGIGPYYAGAIVDYRNRLGGYHQLEQLMELYQMDSLKFSVISRELYLDSLPLKKIAINTADFKTILSHPYINYETTKYLVNKRKKLGKYAALYQLKDEKYISTTQWNKILPYIHLD